MKVYVAGKLNDMACNYIKNVHEMIFWGNEVRKNGFSVYIPAIDLIVGITLGDLDYNDYFDNSQEWLEASDAIFLVPGWETSEGTKKEINRAFANGIPIFSNIEDLIKFREDKNG